MPTHTAKGFGKKNSEIVLKADQNPVSKIMKWLRPDTPHTLFTVENDFCRQAPIRFLGYGFAVAEALRYRMSHETGDPFCLIASGFIAFHCVDCALSAAVAEDSWAAIWPGENRITAMVIVFCDTLIWDLMASVFIPSLVTYCAVSLTDVALEMVFQEDNALKKWLPVIAGIAVLPLFMYAVDTFVDRLMNEAVRILYIV